MGSIPLDLYWITDTYGLSVDVYPSHGPFFLLFRDHS